MYIKIINKIYQTTNFIDILIEIFDQLIKFRIDCEQLEIHKNLMGNYGNFFLKHH